MFFGFDHQINMPKQSYIKKWFAFISISITDNDSPFIKFSTSFLEAPNLNSFDCCFMTFYSFYVGMLATQPASACRKRHKLAEASFVTPSLKFPYFAVNYAIRLKFSDIVVRDLPNYIMGIPGFHIFISYLPNETNKQILKNMPSYIVMRINY